MVMVSLSGSWYGDGKLIRELVLYCDGTIIGELVW